MRLQTIIIRYYEQLKCRDGVICIIFYDDDRLSTIRTIILVIPQILIYLREKKNVINDLIFCLFVICFQRSHSNILPKAIDSGDLNSYQQLNPPDHCLLFRWVETNIYEFPEPEKPIRKLVQRPKETLDIFLKKKN